MSGARSNYAWIPWAVALIALVWVESGLAFSFSEYEQQERDQQQRQSEAAQRRIRENLATHCPESAKHKRIMLLVSEREVQGLTPGYRVGGPRGHIAGYVNNAFQRLGFRTYTEKQITDQVAEAERQAVANGDLDAAEGAARRLAADYILKANVSNRSLRNPTLGIMEVHVDMAFELLSAAGDLVGRASASSESFSGEDTISVAESMARARAPTLASQLYRDICRYETSKQPR